MVGFELSGSSVPGRDRDLNRPNHGGCDATEEENPQHRVPAADSGLIGDDAPVLERGSGRDGDHDTESNHQRCQSRSHVSTLPHQELCLARNEPPARMPVLRRACRRSGVKGATTLNPRIQYTCRRC